MDALYLSGRCEVPAGLVDVLEAGRERAVEAGGPVPFEPLGDGWMLARHGFGKYRYCLAHESEQVGVTTSERLPALRVQARAGFLHGVGPRAALGSFEELGERLAGGPVEWGLSRLDLFCDVQGWTLGGDDRRRFVCRAAKRDLFEDGDDLDGFGFGRRTSKTVSARIYDKTRESAGKGTDWWPKVWGARFDESLPVLRIEFELGRQGLKEFGVDTPTDGLDRAAGIWGGLTEAWLTYRTPTADGTRARWPIATEWATVQQATLHQGALGLERVRAGRRLGQLRKLTPSFVGYLASIGALLDLDEIGPTVAAARHLVEADERRRQVPFADRVAERRSRQVLT